MNSTRIDVDVWFMTGLFQSREESKQKNLNLLLWNLLKNQITKEVLLQDHITLAGVLAAGLIFDVHALMEHLEQVSDQPCRRGVRYALPFLPSVIILAKLCGQNKPSAIAEWVKLRERQLVTAFDKERQTGPSLNTIRRTLAETILAQELHAVFKRFLHQTYGGQQSLLVVLDGVCQNWRGSRRRQRRWDMVVWSNAP